MISATSWGEMVRKLLGMTPHKFTAMKESCGWKGKVRRKGKLGRKGGGEGGVIYQLDCVCQKMFVLEIINRGNL